MGKRKRERTQFPKDKYPVDHKDEKRLNSGYFRSFFNPIDFENYKMQVEASRGFKVDSFPLLKMFGMIIPVPEAATCEIIRQLTECAMDEYNRLNGTKHEVVNVKRATARLCAGWVYFITFHAKVGHEIKTFQTRVYARMGKMKECHFCRPKHTNKSKVTTNLEKRTDDSDSTGAARHQSTTSQYGVYSSDSKCAAAKLARELKRLEFLVNY